MTGESHAGRQNIETYRSPESRDAYAQVREDGFTEEEASVIVRYFTDKDATVLDIGCGTGRTTFALDRLGLDTVGIDVSEPMIREADSYDSDIPLLVGDVTELGFENDSFDYALFSYNGLDLLCPERKRREALREIHRVLKPGGTFVFSSRNAWHVPFPSESPSSLKRWLQSGIALGYKLLSGQISPHYRETNIGIWTGDWEADGISHFIDPRSQKRQLRAHGFKTLEVYGGFFDATLHYVAWKPLS